MPAAAALRFLAVVAVAPAAASSPPPPSPLPPSLLLPPTPPLSPSPAQAVLGVATLASLVMQEMSGFVQYYAITREAANLRLAVLWIGFHARRRRNGLHRQRWR